MLVAVSFFALMDAILKTLSSRYPVVQVVALRGWVALPLILLWITWRRTWPTVWRIRWGLHAMRGVLVMGVLLLFTLGVRGLPLANVYTLFFIAPLLISLLSAPVLGERVPRAHWLALMGGLLGVVIALRPGLDGFANWAGLAALGSAACYAGSVVLGRLSSRTDSSESLMLWIMVMVAVCATTAALPAWLPIRSDDTWLLLALGMTGFGGQLAVTEAFKHGQASAVAPFEYTALAWGLGLDWLIWGLRPDTPTLIGAAVVIGSGLLVIRHERAA